MYTPFVSWCPRCQIAHIGPPCDPQESASGTAGAVTFDGKDAPLDDVANAMIRDRDRVISNLLNERDRLREEVASRTTMFLQEESTACRLRKELTEARRDAERLEFLMQFLAVTDEGDEDVCPSLVVREDALSDAFNTGALADEQVSLVDGWINPDMRRVIDKAISHTKGSD